MWIGNDILPRSFGNPEPFWIPAPSGGGPIALITNGGAASGDTNGAIVSALNTSTANALFATVSSYLANAEPTLSDFYSNIWIPLTAQTIGGLLRQRLWYCAGAIVGSGHTFTVSGTASFPALCVAAFSNVNASPFGSENGATTGGQTLSTGSVTPAVNGSLLITGLQFNYIGSTVPTVDSSFILTNSTAPSGSSSFGAAMAYKIQTTAGAENPQWAVPGGVNGLAASIATFAPV